MSQILRNSEKNSKYLKSLDPRYTYLNTIPLKLDEIKTPFLLNVTNQFLNNSNWLDITNEVPESIRIQVVGKNVFFMFMINDSDDTVFVEYNTAEDAYNLFYHDKEYNGILPYLLYISLKHIGVSYDPVDESATGVVNRNNDSFTLNYI